MWHYKYPLIYGSTCPSEHVKQRSDSIQLSNAKHFVTDPRQFLDDLSKGIVTPDGI